MKIDERRLEEIQRKTELVEKDVLGVFYGADEVQEWMQNRDMTGNWPESKIYDALKASMDKDSADELYEQICIYGAKSQEKGFKHGFALAMKLFMQCTARAENI